MLRLPLALASLSVVIPFLADAWPVSGQPVARGVSSPTAISATARMDRDYGRLPLSFEASDGGESFLARGNGYSIRLNQDGALLGLGQRDVVSMKLVGANPVMPTAKDLLPGTANYFIGNDAKGWRTNIPTYAKIVYSGVYPGIDLVYYGDHRALEYDLVVAPRASVKPIRIHFDGAQVSLEENGDLQIKAQHGVIAFHQPVAYQAVGAKKQPVRARFVKISNTEVGFAVGGYDRERPLVIDPQIAYSTYFNNAGPVAIAVDSTGSAYITGDTVSFNLPVTPGAFQTTDHELVPPESSEPVPCAFVAKLSADGESLLYSTYIGGTGFPGGIIQGHGQNAGGDLGEAIAVDSGGDAYVTGETYSTDFPVTAGAFQTRNNEAYLGATSAFILKLNPSGDKLVYSTYLGGSTGRIGDLDAGYGIAVDTMGYAYVAGKAGSTDFPVTPGAFQTVNKAAANVASNIFVSKLSPDGSALAYSTYIGGSGVALQAYYFGFAPGGDNLEYFTGAAGDAPAGIALDSAGDAYVVGNAASPDYPTTAGAIQRMRLDPDQDPVVTKLNPTGTALVYSTYLGGSGTLLNAGGVVNGRAAPGDFYDSLKAIAVDSAGDAYVAGQSGSSNYPVTAGAFQTTNLQVASATPTSLTDYETSVFSVLNANGTGLVYSTYFGGAKSPLTIGDQATGIAIDGQGDAYLTGRTSASDFPVTSGALEAKFNSQPDTNEAYFAVFNVMASKLVYSTYLGGTAGTSASGMASDSLGNAYVVGVTNSSDFPITPNAFETSIEGTPIKTVNGLQYPNAGFVTKIGVNATGKILTRSVLTITSGANGATTLLATVTPLSISASESVPQGTVTFFNNGSPLGTSTLAGTPTAALTTSLVTSTAFLGCSYSGDTYYSNSNCVVLPDFAIVLASPTITVQSGKSATTSATLLSLSGFADTIGVACGTLPAHIACQFTPSFTPLAGNGSAEVSLTLNSAPASATAQDTSLANSLGQLALLLLPVSLLASRRLRRSGRCYGTLCCALALSLATLVIGGCGRDVYPYALPAGTYTIPIIANAHASGVTHTVQLTLVVTP